MILWAWLGFLGYALHMLKPTDQITMYHRKASDLFDDITVTHPPKCEGYPSRAHIPLTVVDQHGCIVHFHICFLGPGRHHPPSPACAFVFVAECRRPD